MTFSQWGGFAFGLVIGWITYRTLRRREGGVALSDIATVLGTVGGAAVVALFKTAEVFGAYAIGLATGFFLYLIIAFALGGREEIARFVDVEHSDN
jgi:hypothetical protein